MNHEVLFDSIESAQEFLSLFAEVVLETKRNIQAYVQGESTSNILRRLEALQIIASLLEKLEIDVKQSRRILNDLRSLRRLLLGERATGTAVPAKSIKTAGATSSSSTLGVSRSGGVIVSTYITVKRRALSASRAADGALGEAIPWYVRQDKKPIERTDAFKAAS